MARATWAYRPLRWSPWVFKYTYYHQTITQTHPRGDRMISEKIKFRQFSANACQPENSSILTGKGA